MYHNFHASLRQKAIKSLLSIVILLLMCFAANAQRRSGSGLTYGGGGGYGGGAGSYGGSEWGISLNAGYDVPTSDLAASFKSAPTFGISLLHNIGSFTFNATIGYVSYKPKLDTFYYDETDHTAGYIHFNNFSSFEFYAGAAYNIPLGEQAKLYVGLNVGTYYTHFAYDSNDGAGYEDAADTYNEASYVAPKVGITFMLSDNISLGVEGKYNFQISSSSGSGDAFDLGYTTSVNQSYSGNVVLTYNF